MRHPKLLFALLFGVSLLPLSLLGCSGNQGAQAASKAEQAASKAGQAANLTRQLKDIDDNTHMPPAAKEAAKAMIRQGQNVDLGSHK